MSKLVTILLFLGSQGIIRSSQYTPVVIWHGLGDHASSEGIQSIIDSIKQKFPGIYVKSLLFEDNPIADSLVGMFVSSKLQVKVAMDIIKDDPNLRDGYTAIGLSQGGLLFRAIAQRDETHKMKALITLGSPHQGHYGASILCGSNMTKMCVFITEIFSHYFYDPLAQLLFTPASYWRDPFDYNTYVKNCTFLPELNHELKDIESERANFKSLEKLILVMFGRDRTLSPPESAWFGYYKRNSVNVTDFKNTEFYKQDKLGFRDMVINKKVDFIELPGVHLEFELDWLGHLLEEYVGSPNN